jgi:hypothetical protein
MDLEVFMKISPELKGSLTSLTHYLEKTNQSVEFQIIGSFAMELKGYQRKTHTNDIDLIQDLENENVAGEINRIGEHVKNELWMNVNALDIPRPAGFESRTERVEYNERVVFLVPCHKDMILLKVAAAIDRVKDDRKDIDDLLLLRPSKADVEEGIVFYRNSRMAEIIGTKFEEDANQRMTLVRRLLGF